MKYNTKEKIRIVRKIERAKNITAEALKLGISLSTYYFWLHKYKTTGSIENISRRSKYSPNKITNKKIIERIKELHKDGRGKYYIKAQLKFENIVIGTSAITGVLKRAKLWKHKKRKLKKRYNKKFVSKITKAGEIVPLKGLPREDARSQIDTKYLTFNGKKYFQFTAVDLATRFVWREIYDNKTPENATSFLENILKMSTFKIKSVQSDNGTEFIYRCLDTDIISQFDLFCEIKNIKRRFIPVATPRYNGVVERVHATDERELYQKLDKNISLNELKSIVSKYNHFYNIKRLHSSLDYNTIKNKFKLLRIPFPICPTP